MRNQHADYQTLGNVVPINRNRRHDAIETLKALYRANDMTIPRNLEDWRLEMILEDIADFNGEMPDIFISGE